RPNPVVEAWMGAHPDVVLLCHNEGLVHDHGVAGMETAGDVGGAHDLQHLGVVAHHPEPEALAYVAVQVHAFHCPLPNLTAPTRGNSPSLYRPYISHERNDRKGAADLPALSASRRLGRNDDEYGRSPIR